MITDLQYERIARYLDGEAVELSAEELSAAGEIRAGESQVGGLLEAGEAPVASMLGEVRAAEAALGTALDVRVSPLRLERAVRRSMLRDVRADEASLAPMLDAKLPPGRVQRIYHRAMLADVRADLAAVAALLDAPLPATARQRALRRLDAELMRPQRWLMRLAAGAAVAAAAAVVFLAVMLQPAANPVGPGGLSHIGVIEVKPPPEPVSLAVRSAEDAAINLLAAEVSDMKAEMGSPSASVSMDLRIEKLQNEVRDFWLELPASAGAPPGGP